MADIQVIVDDVGEVFYLIFRDGPSIGRSVSSWAARAALQLFHIAYRDGVDVVSRIGCMPNVDIERYLVIISY